MHINIRGLRRNIEELIFTLEEKTIDIAFINEVFLKPEQKIIIPGYKIIRKDRSSGKGGGVVLIVKDNISFDSFELNINNNKGNVEYITIKINTKNLKELIICSYYSPKGIVYEQLFEKLENISNNLLIMGDFNAKHVNLGSEETNHYGNKLIDILNYCNLFVVQNNNHTRYDSFRDKMDTIDYIIISRTLIANISGANSELDIPSDHCTMTVTLKSEKIRSENRNISLKLYHKANWSKINGNIKNKLNKLSGILDILKRRPVTEIKLFLDELANKLIEIINDENEKSIPEIKIKERNSNLPEFIRQKIKNKRSLRRLYIQTKDQNIKPTLNSIKKEIKKDINNYREKQWENKLRKIKISSDPKDWRNIKNILGMEKEKIKYPDLTLGNRKATTKSFLKTVLFKQFLETIFITEPEHTIFDQEKN